MHAGSYGIEIRFDGTLTLQALFHGTKGVKTTDLIVLDVVAESCDVQLDMYGLSLAWALRILHPELCRTTYDRATTTAAVSNVTTTT